MAPPHCPPEPGEEWRVNVYRGDWKVPAQVRALVTTRTGGVSAGAHAALNPAYLAKLRNVIDSDIIVFDSAGEVAASTVQER